MVTPCTQRQGAEFEDVSLSLSQRYTKAIQTAGGLSWVPPIDMTPQEIHECVRRSDGVLLTGGNDVATELYTPSLPDSLRTKTKGADHARDLMELELIKAVFDQRKPLLAICRGQQIVNVAFGGTLLVDIPTQLVGALDHKRMDRKDVLVHKVALATDSILARVTHKTVLMVNSAHHQAVDRVAKPFRISAVSPDGVIEGLELRPEDLGLLPYFLAVQFHPERLFDKHAEFLDMFRDFVEASHPRG